MECSLKGACDKVSLIFPRCIQALKITILTLSRRRLIAWFSGEGVVGSISFGTLQDLYNKVRFSLL